MSLYGDLPPPSSTKEASSIEDGTSGSLARPSTGSGSVVLPPSSVGKAPLSNKSIAAPHFLPSKVLRRPNTSAGPKFTSFRKPPVFKPTIISDKAEAVAPPVFTSQISSIRPPSPESSKSAKNNSSGVQDEYDPAYPNDFAEMQRLQEEAQYDKAMGSHSCSSSPRSNVSYNGSPKYSSGSTSPKTILARPFGAVPPPPSLNTNAPSQAINMQQAQSGEEAYLRRLRLSQPSNLDIPQSVPFPTSKVILLKNMPREDSVDQLKEETENECANYGQVVKCFVYMAPPEIPDEFPVRIFVEFSTHESAATAKQFLHNRIFSGRTIQVELFDEELYYRYDIDSRLEELAKMN